MNLPDRFEAADKNSDEARYTVTKDTDGMYVWLHLRSNTPHVYSEHDTINLLSDYWQIINQPHPNGIDTNGTPIYFDKTMLKQFDRVVTRSGEFWIVTKVDQELILNGEGTKWLSDFYEDDSGYDAVKVYSEPPAPRHKLSLNTFGELRWKRQAIPVEETSLQKQKKELQKSAEAAKKALAEAQDTLGNIQEQIAKLGD